MFESRNQATGASCATIPFRCFPLREDLLRRQCHHQAATNTPRRSASAPAGLPWILRVTNVQLCVQSSDSNRAEKAFESDAIGGTVAVKHVPAFEPRLGFTKARVESPSMINSAAFPIIVKQAAIPNIVEADRHRRLRVQKRKIGAMSIVRAVPPLSARTLAPHKGRCASSKHSTMFGGPTAAATGPNFADNS
jgi:hypothetical protein